MMKHTNTKTKTQTKTNTSAQRPNVCYFEDIFSRLRSFPRACVICVGSTGAGKSSTISLVGKPDFLIFIFSLIFMIMGRHHCCHPFKATGNAVALSDSSGSVTKHCQVIDWGHVLFLML